MKTWRRLTLALGPVRAAMILSTVARVVQLGAGIALVATGVWGVAARATGELSSLWLVLAGLAALAIVKAGAAYVEQYQGHHVAFGLLAQMRADFFRRVEPLAPAALADTRSGDLAERVMSDVDRVEVFYAHTVAPLVAGVVVPALTAAVVAIWVNPGLGLILAAAMILVGFVVPPLSARTARRAAHRAGAASGELAAHVTDGVQGLAEVVIFDYGRRRLEEMESRSDAIGRAEGDAARLDGIRAGLNQGLISGTVVIIAVLGLDRLQAGELGLPALAAALAVALVAFRPLQDLQQARPAFDRAMAAAERIFAITDRDALVTEPNDSMPPEPQPGLRFQGVGFAYPGRDGAVRAVDMALEPGHKVAIVGPSGAGKSTLARLAVRFWDPDCGRITLGSHDLRCLELGMLRQTVSLVAQESHLFNATVADNLRLGRPAATTETLRRVAAVAGIAEDIEQLPAGYDTAVGEMGVRLSGGQRQRIALARGLLVGAPVLVLDEATSELDIDTEGEILRRLTVEAADRALLVIAHRLAAVVDAEEILVMEAGRIIQRGTHEELLATEGLYSRLWARQTDEL